MPELALHLYSSLMAQFGEHWENANAALGGTPQTELKLTGGFGRTQFLASRDAIDAALEDFADKENDWEGALFDRDQLRTTVRDKVMQVRNAVQLYLPDSRFVEMLPETPQTAGAPGRLLAAARDAKKLWAKVDAATGISGFTPPLKLGGGYGLTEFTADLDLLEVRFDAVTAAEDDLQQVRKNRDVLLAAAYERMRQYRVAVPLHFPPEHPLVITLPDLTPPGGGEPPSGVPAAPGAPTLTNIGVGQVGVAWTAVAGALSYNLYKQVMGTDPNYVLVGPVMIGSTSIPDLPPGETVRVRLTASNAAGEGPPGPHAEITLPE